MTCRLCGLPLASQVTGRPRVVCPGCRPSWLRLRSRNVAIIAESRKATMESIERLDGLPHASRAVSSLRTALRCLEELSSDPTDEQIRVWIARRTDESLRKALRATA